jgi:hypothetical protein
VAVELPHPVARAAVLLVGLILCDEYVVRARVAHDGAGIRTDLQRDPEPDFSVHIELDNGRRPQVVIRRRAVMSGSAAFEGRDSESVEGSGRVAATASWRDEWPR